MPNVFRFKSKDRNLSCELTSLLQVFILELTDTKSGYKSYERPVLSKERRLKMQKLMVEEATRKKKLQKAILESKTLKP